MILKLIVWLFGKLTPEQKQEVLNTLTQLVQAAAAGAVSGAMKK